MIPRIAVLLGGLSPERAVSLVSGQAIAQALKQEGFEVTSIDAGMNLWEQLTSAQPDIIINALHGEWGEDGRVQGVLDLYGKPYSHSGVMASALAMDKHRSKAILSAAGITTAQHKLVPRETAAAAHVMAAPYVIKPNAQGSSVGIYLVRDDSIAPPQEMLTNDDMGDMVMVEQYIGGRELTVAVMDGKALCVTEIVPKTDWYEPRDSIVNKMVMLEVNTQPGMTPTSLAPEQAAHMGLSFRQLCRWMVEDASWPR